MTKAAICIHCWDIVTPHRDWEANRAWRWCSCQHAAARWRDGSQGLLEVSALHGPDFVRVLGLNNSFLMASSELPKPMSDAWWQEFHAASTAHVPQSYLFHKDRRDCWAVLIRIGESGDVFWIDHTRVLGGSVPTAFLTSHSYAEHGRQLGSADGGPGQGPAAETVP